MGGPGAGKTWLARRYARDCAQAALDRLLAGEKIADVELPVLSTWSGWARQSGDAREALVHASFDARMGYSDVGGPEATGRLQRTLAGHARVLAIVDSLDESGDDQAQHRLASLTSSTWRVVVTSRPGSWSNLSIRPSKGDPPRVVKVLDLTYPYDVSQFVDAWFAEQPGRSASLLKQIAGRSDLRASAVVPLLLTFYCWIAEAGPEDAVLPERHRDLYRAIVRRLVQGKWSNAPNRELDCVEECETELARWAWSAVKGRVTPSRVTPNGLEAWPETFIRPQQTLTGAAVRALDNVAPVVKRSDDGTVTSRFVHRTILEHLVAEYLATLPVDEAAGVLLPHVWFHEDWRVALPAAVVAHNQCNRTTGELLSALLARARATTHTPGHEAANGEIDDLLLEIAARTEPVEWPQHLADAIHSARIRRATQSPGKIVRSAHWTASNQHVRTAITTALPTARPSAVPRLAEALTTLDPSPEGHDIARNAITKTLTNVGPCAVHRASYALTKARSVDVHRLVDIRTTLDPSPEDRDTARNAIIKKLATASPSDVPYLVRTLREVSTIEEWLRWLDGDPS
ncbi:MAG: hypothetical protein CSA58_03005 [Micrococcales bacterium]|nr:MAG: hypothetical protein CSA58_03005 [Micrococcales bacterium]